MKKLKDIIYDYNDVFVALLIVAVAAGVMLWRINVVMAYPTRVAKGGETNPIDINFNDVNLDPDEIDPIVNPDDEPEPSDEPGPIVDPNQGEINDPGTDEPQPPVADVVNYTLVISKANGNTSWNGVDKELRANGIIPEDAEKLGTRAHALGKDGALQLGTFELNSGMTLDEIVNAVTK